MLSRKSQKVIDEPKTSETKKEVPTNSEFSSSTFRFQSADSIYCKETPMQKSTPIRETPVLESKYGEVWERVKFKIKTKLALSKMQEYLNLPNQYSEISRQRSTEQLSLFLRKSTINNSKLFDQALVDMPKCLLHPNGSFKTFWNLILAILLIYTATIMPFNIAFVEVEMFTTWWWIDLTLDILFFIDVIVNIFSAYYDAEGQLVTSRSKIFCKYLKTWMILDMIACFPVNLIEGGSSDYESKGTDYSNLIRLVRLPRLYRLFRISRIFKMIKHYKHSELLERLQDFLSIKHSAMRLVSFFLTVVLCVHIMSCFWYFSAKLEGFHPDTWVVRGGHVDKDTTTLYFLCVYWAFTTLTTVGYGDISAGTNLEIMFAIIWMSFGLCFFSFTIGSLSSMLSSIDTKETVLTNKLAFIDEFAKEAHLEKELKMRLRHALKYSTEKSGFSWLDKQNIFNELPRQLKYEVAIIMHQGAAKKIPFFIQKEPVFVSAVVPFLQNLFVEENEFIYKEGEYADEIYFITKGKASFVLKNGEPYKQLNRGSYFGDIEVLEMVERKYNVMALLDCDLLTMNKNIVQHIKQEFISVYYEMKEVAIQRDKYTCISKQEAKQLCKMREMPEFAHKSDLELKNIIRTSGRDDVQEQEESLRPKTKKPSLNYYVQDIRENKKQIQELKETLEDSNKMTYEILGLLRKANYPRKKTRNKTTFESLSLGFGIFSSKNTKNLDESPN